MSRTSVGMPVKRKVLARKPFISLFDLAIAIAPFTLLAVAYFVIADNVASPKTCVLKTAPIIALCQLVKSSSGQSGVNGDGYASLILRGLLFSAAGDALLVWDEYFIPGMIAFAAAHVFFIIAFGLNPRDEITGIGCGLVCLLLNLLYSSKLDGILAFAVPIYSTILMTMVWRSLAQTGVQNEFSGRALRFRRLAAGGALLFALSDSLLAANQFNIYIGLSRSLIKILVMVTYYAAQLGIALSALNRN